MTTLLEAFWAKVSVGGPDECWPWQGTTLRRGHGQFVYRQKRYYAHRIAMGTIADVPDDKLVCHRCNVPGCVNPRHLYIGDHGTNARDAIEAGTFRYRHPGWGEENSTAKLNWDAVNRIRDEYSAGTISQRALARQHGVCLAAVQKVLKGKTWRAQPSQL